MQYLKTLKNFLFEIINKYPKEFLILVILMVAEAFLIAISVLSLIPFADYLFDPTLADPNKFTKILISILSYFNLSAGYLNFTLIFILSNFLKAFSSLFIKYRILKIKFSIEKSISIEILNKILLARWSFFNNVKYGTILNSLTKEINFIGSASRSIGEVFANFFNIFTYILIPFFIDPKLTLYIILSSFIIGVPFLLLSKVSKKFGEKRTSAGNNYIGKLNETIQSAKLINGFGLFKKELNHNISFLQKYIDADLKSQITNVIAMYLFKPLGLIALIFVFSFIFKIENIPSYAAVFWSFYGALPLIGNILNTAVIINNYQPSYKQISNIINRAEKYYEKNGEIKISEINDDIIFKNIGFSYDENKIILNNCNLTIFKNKINALIGDSGVGKSTIIDLLMGFQKATSGEIFINQTKIDELDLNYFRQNIGYVPQDPMLFHTSIKNNIMWAKNNNISEDQVVEALKLANALEFVMSFPNKLETTVGEKGTEISGGQRQRIALARALVRKPKLLILDEPTSSIDTESENLINETLKKLSSFTTIVMISHSQETKNISDFVNIIENGKATNLKT